MAKQDLTLGVCSRGVLARGVLKAQPDWAEHGNPQVQRVWGILQSVGLDVDKVKRDMDNPRFDAILKQDAQDIAVLQVKKTPTFCVNGRLLLEHDPDTLRAMVLQEIKASYPWRLATALDSLSFGDALPGGPERGTAPARRSVRHDRKTFDMDGTKQPAAASRCGRRAA